MGTWAVTTPHVRAIPWWRFLGGVAGHWSRDIAGDGTYGGAACGRVDGAKCERSQGRHIMADTKIVCFIALSTAWLLLRGCITRRCRHDFATPIGQVVPPPPLLLPPHIIHVAWIREFLYTHNTRRERLAPAGFIVHHDTATVADHQPCETIHAAASPRRTGILGSCSDQQSHVVSTRTRTCGCAAMAGAPDVAGIGWRAPILQVVQVRQEAGVVQVLLRVLRQVCGNPQPSEYSDTRGVPNSLQHARPNTKRTGKVFRVGQALHKLQLHNEALLASILGLGEGHGCWCRAGHANSR